MSVEEDDDVAGGETGAARTRLDEAHSFRVPEEFHASVRIVVLYKFFQRRLNR